MDKISVIVPVYNMEKYLARCLDSIVNQSYKNLEIILIDDGSTDSSPEICDQYAQSDARVKVIHKENGGVSAARNLGASKATGDFLAFVDSDDYIDLRMYEILMRNQKKYNADISICDFISTGNDSEPSVYSDICQPMNAERALYRLYTDKDIAFVSFWGKIIRTDFFNGITLPAVKCAEDNFVMYRLLYRADTVVFDESTLYKYFQRGDSEVHTFDESSSFDFLAFDEQMAFWEKEDKPELLRVCFVRNFKRLIMTLDCSRNARKSDDFYDFLLGRYYETVNNHIKNVKIGPIEKKLYLLDWKDFEKHRYALLYIRVKSKLRVLSSISNSKGKLI